MSVLLLKHPVHLKKHYTSQCFVLGFLNLIFKKTKEVSEKVIMIGGKLISKCYKIPI